jgi:hypothetical protein
MTIGIADALEDPNNVPVVDKLKYTHEFGLPVFFIDSPPTEEVFIPVTVTALGRAYAIEAKLRGASSLSYPKKNYSLRFGTGISFDDVEHDFVDRDRVILTSTFDDNSYLRQRMAYELWSLLDPTIKMRAYSAVVYLDGAYHGLYTVNDFPDDHLMEDMGLPATGNLFKAVNHNANFRDVLWNGDPKNNNWSAGYEKTEGTPEQGQPGAFDDLNTFVSFAVTSDDPTFNSQIGSVINIDDYASWWLLVSFITASDSAGKNSYHYHDPTDGSALWTLVPWDFNHSFGQSWKTNRVPAASVATYTNYNGLFNRILNHPTHGPAITARYSDLLRGGVFSKDAMLAFFDERVAEIDRSAKRDWAIWSNAYENFGRWAGERNSADDWTTYEEEVAYVRQWLSDHWDAVAAAYPDSQ